MKPSRRLSGSSSSGKAAHSRLPSRERIITAALELLAEGGYPAVSIAAICKRADVATASLYHHFGDKAGLLAALIAHSAAITTREFVSMVANKDSPFDQLNEFITATRDIGRDRVGNMISVLSAIASASKESPDTARTIDEARKRAWGVSAAEFNEAFGIEDGMFMTHICFAFASYVDHIAQSSATTEDARKVFKSYARAMFLVTAAIRPDFMNDPQFATAVAHASQERPASPHPPSSKEEFDV